MKLDWFHSVKLVVITGLTPAPPVIAEPAERPEAWGSVTPQRHPSGPSTFALPACDFPPKAFPANTKSRP